MSLSLHLANGELGKQETNRQTINLWQVSHFVVNLTTKTTARKKGRTKRGREGERETRANKQSKCQPPKTIFQANIYKSERELQVRRERRREGGQTELVVRREEERKEDRPETRTTLRKEGQ